MARNIGLTRREEELMDFLWEYEQPITSNNILESYDTSYWSESYLYVMLRSLEKKGLLKQVEPLKYGAQYSRQFACAMTKEEYYVTLAAGKSHLDKNTFAELAVAMALRENKAHAPELIEKLERLLADAAQGKKPGPKKQK
ncbi:MAG: BlaI/MecI/CopY family transcriptional regulator [Acutalibacter sp.]|nr:BlaI/MecI/CopY family transcriptional regulator [Acutalibacter sp.]